MATGVLLDTNVWRQLVDDDAVQRLRNEAREARITILAAPAVVHEMLRTRDPALRTRLAKAVTLGVWRRLMPEVYEECQDFLTIVRRRRPGWLLADPDLASFHRLRADWDGGRGFWDRARTQPSGEAAHLAALEGDRLAMARAEAQEQRDRMQDLHFDSLRATGWTTSLRQPLSGWNGNPVDSWRFVSAGTWWHLLVEQPSQPHLDWLDPFIDRARLASDFGSWNRLWLHEVETSDVPREWLRWAIRLFQGVRRITSGTPADNQIALYAYRADVFISSDRALIEILEKVRPDAPADVALPVLVPHRADAVRTIVSAGLR